MTETFYPRSLRQALAYLDVNPLVCMCTRYARTITRSHWWFAGRDRGTLWFEPYPVGPKRAHTGLDLFSSEFEVGIEFDARGFSYSRGTITIRVDYAHTLEQRDESLP